LDRIGGLNFREGYRLSTEYDLMGLGVEACEVVVAHQGFQLGKVAVFYNLEEFGKAIIFLFLGFFGFCD